MNPRRPQEAQNGPRSPRRPQEAQKEPQEAQTEPQEVPRTPGAETLLKIVPAPGGARRDHSVFGTYDLHNLMNVSGFGTYSFYNLMNVSGFGYL